MGWKCRRNFQWIWIKTETGSWLPSIVMHMPRFVIYGYTPTVVGSKGPAFIKPDQLYLWIKNQISLDQGSSRKSSVVSNFMVTSSNGKFSTTLALCAGNSPVTGEFPSQRPVTQSFDVFFDLRLNKRLSNQSRRWWLETPYCSFWCHCDVCPYSYDILWLAGRFVLPACQKFF